jgi:endonuclease YncB( thermonuclease family)
MGKLLVLIAAMLGLLYVWQVGTGRAPWTSELIETGAAVPIDGDSIRVNGKEIRLKGIDAPEYGQTCERLGREVACGREAAAALRRQLARGPVTCVGGERDRYGRLLAQCRIMGADIAASLVRDGHAVSFGDYLVEEAEARNDNRGLWSGAFQTPREWRARHPRTPPAGAGEASRPGSSPVTR